MIEEFKRCISTEIKTFIDEQKAENLETAAELADSYSLTHKTHFGNKTQKFFRQQNSFSGYAPKPKSEVNFRQSPAVQAPPKSHPSPQSHPHPPPQSQKLKSVSCNYCKKDGHLISDCYKLKMKKDSEFKPNGFVKSSQFTPRSDTDVHNTISEAESISDFVDKVQVKSPSSPIMEIFEPL